MAKLQTLSPCCKGKILNLSSLHVFAVDDYECKSRPD